MGWELGWGEGRREKLSLAPATQKVFREGGRELRMKGLEAPCRHVIGVVHVGLGGWIETDELTE